MGASSDDKGEDGEDNSKASPADQLNETSNRLFAIVTHTQTLTVSMVSFSRERRLLTHLCLFSQLRERKGWRVVRIKCS